MPHLFVVAGHGDGDPGASGYGADGWTFYEEAERVRALARRIKELGGPNVTLADTSRNFYKDNLWLTYPLDTSWQAVELHMDSAGAGARGAHVIYCSYADPDQYDEALADFVSGMFPGRANKLVGRSDLKNPKQAFQRGIPYRLVENGFISDPTDLERFNDELDKLARGYLQVFGIVPIQSESSDITTDSPAPMPAPAPTGGTASPLWKCMTDERGQRLAVDVLGNAHPIETDAEWWAMTGINGKPDDGSGTANGENILLASVVMARKYVPGKKEA